MSLGPPSSQAPLSIRIGVAAAVAGFVWLGCLWIDLPGLQYDEVLFVTASYPDPQRGGAGYVDFFGQRVCVMVLPYLGALKGWIYRVVAEFTPASAAAVRAPAILLGGLTLAVLFGFARRVFDARAGLLAVLLAATDPTFLFTTRQDWGPVVIQRLCWLGGCLLLLHWRERPEAWRLLAASFVFGVGIFDKLTFLWIMGALVVAALIAVPKEFFAAARPKAIAAAVVGLVLGCLPLLAYRLMSIPRSPGLKWESSPQPILAKLSMLYGALDGTVFQAWMAHVSAPQAAAPDGWLAQWACWWAGDQLLDATWMPWALLAALAMLPFTARTAMRRGLLFAGVFCAAAVALMLPVESGGSVHHLALIYPFPQLFVAASLSGMAATVARMNRARWERLIVFGFTGVLVLTNLSTVVQQYGQILQFGGTPSWTEAVYELHETLEERESSRVIVLDWGIAMQLRLLSRDRLPLQEAPQPAGGDKYFIETIGQGLREPGTVFVGYAPSAASVNPRTRELLDQAARDAGRRLHRVKQIRDRQTRPRFEILEAE